MPGNINDYFEEGHNMKIIFLAILLSACGLFEPKQVETVREVEVEPEPTPVVTCNGFPQGSTRLKECPTGQQGNILEVCSASGAWTIGQNTCTQECDESLEGKVTFYQLKPIITEYCVACHNVPQRFDEYDVAKSLASDFVYRVGANDVNKMPPSNRAQLSIEQRQMFQQWITDGLLESDGCNRRDDGNEWILQDLDYIESRILEDLNNLDARARRESAYLVMSHKLNKWSEQEALDQYRFANDKLLNSLSTENDLIPATVIDARKSIYRVDLDVFGFLLTVQERREGRYSDDWDIVVNEANKLFKFESFTNKGLQIKALTGRDQVWLHNDLYSIAANKANVYYDILGIDENLWAFFEDQGIDIQQQFDDFEVIAGGGFGSPISLNKNRIIYRLNNDENYTYVTIDPDDNFVPEKNYFEFPCILQMNCSETLAFDAGEIIYTLPNGMQGYLLADANNVRQDFAPVNIVSNINDPFGEAQIDNALDCHRCHSKGLISFTDQIRGHVIRNASEFDNEDAEKILATYKGDRSLNANFVRDITFYNEKLSELGIDINKPDPINFLVDDFRRDYDLRAVSAFVLQCINSSAVLRGQIGQLIEGEGNVISQFQFSQVFPIILDECSLNEDPIDR
jgi:hypothetical protein